MLPFLGGNDVSPITAGTHRPAALLALVPGHALGLVGDGTVDRDFVRILVLLLQIHVGRV